MAACILIVEDEGPLRRILVRNLEQRGHHVDEVGAVADALASCAEFSPDVVVLDINLPDGSGWDVLRGLASDGAKRPKVVAISASAPRQSRLAQFSPVTFLEKPFPIEALVRAVERAVVEVSRETPLDHTAV